jgi:hypothetical protein
MYSPRHIWDDKLQAVDDMGELKDWIRKGHTMTRHHLTCLQSDNIRKLQVSKILLNLELELYAGLLPTSVSSFGGRNWLPWASTLVCKNLISQLVSKCVGPFFGLSWIPEWKEKTKVEKQHLGYFFWVFTSCFSSIPILNQFFKYQGRFFILFLTQQRNFIDFSSGFKIATNFVPISTS